MTFDVAPSLRGHAQGYNLKSVTSFTKYETAKFHSLDELSLNSALEPPYSLEQEALQR
jgi:hypothetical protein